MKERNQDDSSAKRRYEPPKIIDSAEFETLALVCGKVGDIPPLFCASEAPTGAEMS